MVKIKVVPASLSLFFHERERKKEQARVLLVRGSSIFSVADSFAWGCEVLFLKKLFAEISEVWRVLTWH